MICFFQRQQTQIEKSRQLRTVFSAVKETGSRDSHRNAQAAIATVTLEDVCRNSRLDRSLVARYEPESYRRWKCEAGSEREGKCAGRARTERG